MGEEEDKTEELEWFDKILSDGWAKEFTAADAKELLSLVRFLLTAAWHVMGPRERIIAKVLELLITAIVRALIIRQSAEQGEKQTG